MDTIFQMIFWIKGVWIEKHFLFGAFLGNLLMQQEAQAYAKTPLAVLSANQSWMKLCMMFLECSDHDRIFEVELLEELSIFLPSRIYLANQDIFDAKTIFPSDREHKKDLKLLSRWVVDFIEFQTGIVKNKGVTTCLDTSVFITHLYK